MQIETIPINQINPASFNPRVNLKPGDPDYERIKASLTTFGCVEPLIWNRQTANLIGGHQRLKVLMEMGESEVQVSVVDLSSEQEKALNIALNKIGGRWDDDKLAQLLEELQKMPDFDVGLTGFDNGEISDILDKFHEAKDDDDFDFDAAVEAIQEPVTQKGDLIELGGHRILCGDSSNIDDVRSLIGDERVSLLHTDPPYNVNYYGGNRPNAMSRPSKHKLWDRIYSDDMSQEEYEAWLKKVLTNGGSYLDQGAAIYVWNGHRQFGPMYQILADLQFHIGCVITWSKERFAIGYGDYNQQTEFCLYGWKEKNGAHKWYGPNNESTLWQIKRDNTTDYIHPTQKPIALAQRAMRNSSNRGDTVLDLFLGSGSTLIAAESLGRRCFGIEIDPKYCDGIVRRYISFVGRDKVSPEIKDKYVQEVTQ